MRAEFYERPPITDGQAALSHSRVVPEIDHHNGKGFLGPGGIEVLQRARFLS